MRSRQTLCIAAAFAWLLLGGFAAGTCQAGLVTYQVSANTSAVSGEMGFLDFQFNPGDATALAATATVINFLMTGGALAQPSTLTGDTSGSLPSTLTLDNGTIYNDIFQGVTFGSSIRFDVTLSGLAVGGSATFGSSFAFSLYDSTNTIPLLTTDPNGSVLTININANGSTSVETFAQSGTNSTPIGGASQVNAVPEPASLTILAVGLLTLCGWKLRASGKRSAPTNCATNPPSKAGRTRP